MSEKDLTTGARYWRSLDELARSPEFERFLQGEFPQVRDEKSAGVSRRKFMSLMGASLAFAGLAGCRRPVERIIPYVTQPEEVTVGVPDVYATTMPFGLESFGLLVECHEGRPTKIEGNPAHPSTLGGSNSIIQASILGLYDPDRSKRVLQNPAERTWDGFVLFWRELRVNFAATGGEGLVVLSPSFASPSLARLRQQVLSEFPNARWLGYDPISRDNSYQLRPGSNAADSRLIPTYDLSKASVILALDSDFLYTEPDSIRNSLAFADGRRVSSPADEMNRLYAVESSYTLTGANADHRLRIKSASVGHFALALLSELRSRGLNVKIPEIEYNDRRYEDNEWLRAVASDLLAHRGRSLVIAGNNQPAWVHAVATAINDALGNIGSTVSFVEPADAFLPRQSDLTDWIGDRAGAGSANTLVILGGNPVFDAPADLRFDEILKKFSHAIHISQHVDETSTLCEWHIPETHFLESWGDACTIDGAASLIQPMIEPLNGGHSVFELANLIATGRDERGYDIVRQTWQSRWGLLDFEKKWRDALRDGVIKEAANVRLEFVPDVSSLSLLIENGLQQHPSGDGIEIAFRTSPSLYDGRFANNAWLQELPDPITKLAWDNAAVISPASAAKLGVENEDVIEIDSAGQRVELPIWIVPGTADDSIALTLGYGRTAAGSVGNNVGSNVYSLRRISGLGFASGVTVTKTGQKHELANTQDHGSMEGRPIVLEATLDEFSRNPRFAKEMVEHPPLQSLWKDHEYDEGYQWGMTVDLNACIGCGACTTACQSENNIMVVGKDQVRRGREMHWIRVDRYFSGSADSPQIVHQPVACQHCETAPCEQVCPVAATVHDREGLNVMVYNRCIGTRYCSNNCPYKVRRFNFFNYISKMPETIKMAQNPDVTVRSRGVMEKCTYCVQRISASKMKAKQEHRTVGGDEVVTACQQACPTKAIQFGNIRDAASRVTRLKASDRNYELLAELNVRPRTSYLAKIRNPNPALEKSVNGSSD